MDKDNKLIIGFLIVVILSTSIYVTMNNKGVRLRVDKDKSTFYVLNENNRWIVSGREYNSLYDGTTKLNRDLKSIEINQIIEDDILRITRYTKYKRGPSIIDNYYFEGNNTDIELFPIRHVVQIYDAKGYYYRYDVRDLYYSGETFKLDGVQTSMNFGKNMKVSWWNGYRLGWIYKSGSMYVKSEKIDSDYKEFDVKLFDPPPNINLTLSGFNRSITAELNSRISINTTIIGDKKVCIDIIHPNYGQNYTCNLSVNDFDMNFTYFRKNTFNDSTTIKNLSYKKVGKANKTVYIRLHQYDELEDITFNLTGYNENGSYPTGLKIFINRNLSNSLDAVYDTTSLNLTTFNDSTSIYNITFDTIDGGFEYQYFKLPKLINISGTRLSLKGYNNTVQADQTETRVDEFNTGELNRSVWANISGGSNAQSEVIVTSSYLLLDSFSEINLRGLYNGTTSVFINNTDIPDLRTNNHTMSQIYMHTVRKGSGPGTTYSMIKIMDETLISSLISSPNTFNPTSGIDVLGSSSNPFAQTYTNVEISYNPSNQYVTVVTDQTGNLSYDVSSLNWATERLLPVFYALGHKNNNIAGDSFQGDMKIYDYNYTTTANLTNFVTNGWLEIGSIDGSREWNQTSTFENSANVTGFNISLKNYLDGCTADSDGFCYPPLTFYSETQGIIEINNIEINYTYQWNPVVLSTDLFYSAIRNGTGFTDVRIDIENRLNGTIELSDLNLDYAGGNRTYEILAHDINYTLNTTLNLTYYYSDWDYKFPPLINYLEFIPRTALDKNVTPYGQTPNRAILNLTGENYARNMNMFFYNNETYSCVDMYASNTNRKPTASLWDKLEFYIPMDIDLRDVSGNDNNGTTNGATFNLKGKQGASYTLNGIDDNISITKSTNWNAANGTVSLWAKLNGSCPSGFCRVWNIFDSVSDYVTSYQQNSNNNLVFVIKMAGLSAITTTYSNGWDETDNSWHHLGYTWSNSTGVKIYFDGSEVATGTNVSSTANTAAFVLGTELNSGFFNGSMDDVRFYNRSLLSSEIFELYNRTRFNQTTNDIVAWYTFDSDTRDVSSNDNGGINNGCTFTSNGYINNAYICNASGNVITVANTNTTNLQNFTLSFWSKLNAPSNSLQGGVAKGDLFAGSNKFGWSFQFSGGTVTFQISNGTTPNDDTTTISDTDWHNWIGVVNSTSISIYKDGSLTSSASARTIGDINYTHNNNSGLNIGATNRGLYQINGTVDDVRIYDTVLNPDEILDIYNLTNRKYFDLKLRPNWNTLSYRSPYLDITNLYLWADFNCTQTSWYDWYPELFFLPCCIGCDVCTEELV